MSVAHAYICFAKESYFDNVCMLKTDPCQNPTMKNSDHLLELFLPNQKKQNFQGFNTLSNSNHKMKHLSNSNHKMKQTSTHSFTHSALTLGTLSADICRNLGSRNKISIGDVKTADRTAQHFCQFHSVQSPTIPQIRKTCFCLLYLHEKKTEQITYIHKFRLVSKCAIIRNTE